MLVSPDRVPERRCHEPGFRVFGVEFETGHGVGASMARLGLRIDAMEGWGPAETAALDRCIAWQDDTRAHPVAPRPAHLARVIESEIIPRLLLAHAERTRSRPPESDEVPTVRDVEAVAGFAVSGSCEAVLGRIAEVRERGIGIDAVLLDLLAPAARRLGDLWDDDMCSFTDVTLGLATLQQVLRRLGPGAQAAAGLGRILLAPVPGEQHSFGNAMLEDFFRRAGWEVEGGTASKENLLESVRSSWFDVVGLSLSSELLFDKVRPAIHAIRRASQNADLVVMVGGPFFLDHPDRVAEAGADASARDAPEALLRAVACLRVVIEGR